MKISARNILKGKVVGIQQGGDDGPRPDRYRRRRVVTASITNAAVDDLELTVGKDAYAVVKASDVMVAVD